MVLPALLAVLPAPVRAQAEAREASTRAAQFVLVIDDSRSMDKTDPNRLAVFAAQALFSMLDDRDEVSIVRLNGPVQGETPPPIEPLATNREAMQRLLGGRIAAYGGNNTTCRSALQATQRLLNQAYRPNVAQVVLFLTDGACTPAATERPDPAAFLGGLRSHEEDLFQFYLLRFVGLDVSPELGALARQTGGDTIEVGSTDPTAILHAFATALSRSQGYEAALLTPEDPEIAAHRGAKRVRLLAVARGQSPPLGLAVHD
jgi:Mg-chelatase subunit ChlD